MRGPTFEGRGGAVAGSNVGGAGRVRGLTLIRGVGREQLGKSAQASI